MNIGPIELLTLLALLLGVVVLIIIGVAMASRGRRD
jgi:hypothetical protein